MRSLNLAAGGCGRPEPPLAWPPMFGRLNVLKDGEQIDGIVLDSKTSGMLMQSNAHPLGDSNPKVTVRIHFPDGSVEEPEIKVKGRDYSIPFGTGETIPLRYDPNDHSRVEV